LYGRSIVAAVAMSRKKEERPRSRFVLIALAAVALFAGSTVAFWRYPESTPAKELLRAPTIVVGKVPKLSVRKRQNLLMPGYGQPHDVEMLDAAIMVQRVLKGEHPGKAIVVRGLVRPANPDEYIPSV